MKIPGGFFNDSLSFPCMVSSKREIVKFQCPESTTIGRFLEREQNELFFETVNQIAIEI